MKNERTYVEINLDNIQKNIREMNKKLPADVKMLAVIKANGYGHGSIPIAKCLESMQCVAGYAVATAEEAISLRDNGISKLILILGYVFPDYYTKLIEQDIRIAVFRKDSILQLVEASRKVGKTAKVHVKVDTGMGRIGISPDEEGIKFVKELMRHKEIEVEGIFTHFAKADEKDKTDTQKQIDLFLKFNEMIEKLGWTIPLKHCANSAAILEVPTSIMSVVRAGIAMYGLYPSEEINRDNIVLEPALSWYSRIVYVKTIRKGQSVSYGGLYTASKDVRIATIPVGYGDGYPRSLSQVGYVLIHGKKAPIVGRVCMDQFMVDISDIPDAREDDEVVLLGRMEEESISAECLGELSGRFNYELVCDINARVPRRYTLNEK